MAQLDCSDLRLFAQLEGTVVFPRVPLLRVEGPLIIAQLVETPLLTLVNYASLVATNAMRHRLVAGDNITLLEFGLCCAWSGKTRHFESLSTLYRLATFCSESGL